MSHVVREPLPHGGGTRITFGKAWRNRLGDGAAVLGTDSVLIENRRVNRALLTVMVYVWEGFFGITLTDEFIERVGTPRPTTQSA